VIDAPKKRTKRLLEFGTLDGILGCAAAGLGITLLPTSVIKSSRWRDSVRLHEPPPDHARVDTLFIRRRDGFLSADPERQILQLLV
jgi:LysR family transcriptional regulator, cell division regulator